MNEPDGMAQRIRERLNAVFAPVSLNVIDDSRKHAGHAHLLHSGKAAQPSGTHFAIKLVSKTFKGKSRIERHRMINAALAAEIADGVHALAIEAKAPGE